MDDAPVFLLFLFLAAVLLDCLWRAAKWVLSIVEPIWRAIAGYRRRQREQQQHRDWETERKRLADAAAEQTEYRLLCAGHELRSALRQIPAAPDYRRAAAVAMRCGELPVSDRRFLFHEFRPLIEQHATVCLQQRIDQSLLAKSLHDLLSALAIETFEADYIIRTAVQTIQNQVPLPRYAKFQDQIDEEMLLHRERLHAITQALDSEDLLEQLQEAERRRHEEVLLRLTTGSGSSTRMITTV